MQKLHDPHSTTENLNIKLTKHINSLNLAMMKYSLPTSKCEQHQPYATSLTPWQTGFTQLKQL